MFIGGLPDTPHQPMFGQTFDVAEMFYVQLFVCRISATYGVVYEIVNDFDRSNSEILKVNSLLKAFVETP